VNFLGRRKVRQRVCSGGTMDEKELTQWLHEMFQATIPALENIEKGFVTQNQTMLQQGETQFVEILTSSLSFADKTITEGQKSKGDRRFLYLLVPLQRIALAVRGLIAKKKLKLVRDVTFNDRVIVEVTELLTVMKTQFRDTGDLIITKNPTLKENIKSGMERIIKMADEYAVMHEERLSTGMYLSKASYLYLDIIDSIRRISRELVSFSERV
jgi:Na+/phosphate symporter